MIWNKSLETGVPKIDGQHMELFRQADILLDRSQDDRLEKTIEFLKSYVARHFYDEEILHKTSKYPKAEAHKKLHVAFSAVFADLCKEFEISGKKLNVVLKINSTVIGWLKDHIMVHDKEFANYYHSLTGK